MPLSEVCTERQHRSTVPYRTGMNYRYRYDDVLCRVFLCVCVDSVCCSRDPLLYLYRVLRCYLLWILLPSQSLASESEWRPEGETFSAGRRYSRYSRYTAAALKFTTASCALQLSTPKPTTTARTPQHNTMIRHSLFLALALAARVAAQDDAPAEVTVVPPRTA